MQEQIVEPELKIEKQPEPEVSTSQQGPANVVYAQVVTEIQEEENLPPIPSLPKSVRNAGHLLLGISVMLFCITEYFNIVKDNGFIFLVHYIMALSYAVILIRHKAYGARRSWRKRSINATAVLLNLFLISAFALNRDLTIFMESATWFAVYMVLSSVTLLSLEFINKLPPWVQKIQSLFLGSAIAFYVYSALYVAMFYVYGLMGMVLFGIGAHVFVPLIFVILCLAFVVHLEREGPSIRWTAIGFLFPLLIAIGFTLLWHSRVKSLETVAKSAGSVDNVLPAWVMVAQSVKNDWITQKTLKARFMYQTVDSDRFSGTAFRSDIPGSDAIIHDPLVLIADGLSPLKLADDEILKVLQYSAGNADPFNERLWSGTDLTSASIESDVTIFNDLRLSYTEKTFDIKNNGADNSWRSNTQEAIYTFYLPVGSAVTTLSLWINGKEQQGTLTTKQKATTAYTQIVGVEQRDPSVIHWQEGNRVRVRVFPCTIEEQRRFKIGVISPLAVEGGQVIYRDVKFNGPSPENARDAKRVRIIGASENPSLPSAFRRTYSGDYVMEGKYDEDFSFKLPLNPMVTGNINFNGYEYSVQPFSNSSEPVTLTEIFLDINNSWNSAELNAFRPILKSKKIYVYNGVTGETSRLTSSNFTAVTEKMLLQNFSLFPFHKLKNVANTLVVTKGNRLSPHLQNFPDSKFTASIASFFDSGEQVKTFNIGDESSTYIASLAEALAINYTHGTIKELINTLERNVYPLSADTQDVVSFPATGISIHRKKQADDIVPDNAPDQLMQLFAYNDLLKKIGIRYLGELPANDGLNELALEANVVTPLSSLIVLETQRDYERFGIKGDSGDLQQAAISSAGSVPEPHEWVLISLFIAFAIYVKFRR